MAKDEHGREWLSTGAIAKDLGVTAGAVKKALTALGLEPDLVKAGCAYYSADRLPVIKDALR